ncbi:MAG: hypothetical protein DRN08_01565 [Thermoplasmata archaeon]|nr:MAG: hypothetical protein DRN08_01565 [Thermoplasmata archaeon]
MNVDERAVSHVLGYLLSFSIAFIVMTGSIIITTSIINDRLRAAAGIKAQGIANQIADVIIDAVRIEQSMPNAGYKKTIEIPRDLSGYPYYVEVTSNAVYVNTTDGMVSRSSTLYNIGKTGAVTHSDRIYSSQGSVMIYVNKSDFVYKLDLGVGDSREHSPVASRYYIVSNETTIKNFERDPPWTNTHYHYRMPIWIDNNSTKDLAYYPVRITLNPDNFDYGQANVTYLSTSRVLSDLRFVYLGGYLEVSKTPPLGGYNSTHVRTIQEAINNATDGDTIYVHSGVYHESIIIDKQLNIIGEGKDTTIIDGDYADWTVKVEASNVHIERLAIINGGPRFIEGGILLDGSSNQIINCSISDNKGTGVYLYTGSSNNIIEDCIIHNNSYYGIVLRNNADNNTILNCDVSALSNNGGGILFADSCNNTIRYCNIHNNTYYGIYMSHSYDNVIINCTIRDHPANRSLNISMSERNLICYNNFINNTGEYGVWINNTWNNSYVNPPSCGNYWDDYKGNDLFHGPGQNLSGSDGVGDTPYTISSGIQDMYPRMQPYDQHLASHETPYFMGAEIPYYIDYWNPSGESSIILDVSLESNTSKILYMYYGYDMPLTTNIHSYSIADAVEFFEDFTSPEEIVCRWNTTGMSHDLYSPDVVGSSCINLSGYDFIVLKGDDRKWECIWNPSEEDWSCLWRKDQVYYIPYTPVEGIPGQLRSEKSLYIVEAKIKPLSGYSSIILLGQHQGNYNDSYTTTIDLGSSTVGIRKQNEYQLFFPNNNLIPVNETSIPDLNNRWLRVKTYIYCNHTIDWRSDPPVELNTTVVKSYFYDFDTYTYLGCVSGLDNNSNDDIAEPPEMDSIPNEEPFKGGRIGLLAGLYLRNSETGSMSVDWIRVLNLTPVVQPTVRIGPIETLDCGWEQGYEHTASVDTSSTFLFQYGPLHRDFINISNNNCFYMDRLTPGIYTFTLTIGTPQGASSASNLNLGVLGTTDSSVAVDQMDTYKAYDILLPSTQQGEIKKVSFTVEIPRDDQYVRWALKLLFNNISPGEKKPVTSILLERGQRGVKIGYGG